MRRILILALILTAGSACLSAQSDQPIQSDQEIQSEVQRALSAYALTSIHSSVQDGAVTLTGPVILCRDRLLADEMASHIQGVQTIHDLMNVSGPSIPDAQLQAFVERVINRRHHKLGWFGYGSITVQVQDGIVALYGTAAPELTAPIVDEIARTQGVKNLIDRVHRVPPYDSSWRRSHPPQMVAGKS
jgi:hypothetical protein